MNHEKAQRSLRKLLAAMPPLPAARPENVDRGVIDNDPFDLTHDYLLTLNPVPGDGQNPREALKVDRALITVAPFPALNPPHAHESSRRAIFTK